MKEKEHQSIEWKESWQDEYLKWIRGYANAYGGTIYIGTDDDGNVVGIDNARDLLERIPNKITDTMGIIADVNLLYKGELEYVKRRIDSGEKCELKSADLSVCGKMIFHGGALPAV